MLLGLFIYLTLNHPKSHQQTSMLNRR